MRAELNVLLVVMIAASAALGLAPGFTFAGDLDEQGLTPPEPEFHVVRVEVSGRDEIEFLGRWLDVWDVDPQRGILEAAVDDEGFEVLRDFGFHYSIDEKRTEKYNRPFVHPKRQTEGIPYYPCYRTVEETLADGAALAALYPDLAEFIDIGDSWEKTAFGGNYGYDLMVLRLTNTTNGIPSADKPKLWVMGSIHAREYTTAETVTRFGEYLLANYDLDPDVTWLLEHHEIHLLLVTNPDGRKHAEAGLSWRKNTNQNYCGPTSDDRGADLNRNFDFQWGCCGGSSGSECATTYRGPSPASEPESQAVQSWVSANFTDWRPDDLTTPAPDHATGIFIDVHSYGGDVLTAFGFQNPPPPNDTQILRLGRKFSFFTGYYARLGSISTVDGSTKDFGYGRLGLPAFTFELGNDFFQDCASFESTIYPDNLQTLLYAARTVRAPYTQSSGPEVVSPAALPSTPFPGQVVTVTAILDDTRFGPGESSPPASVETIAAAEVYLDVPPWQAGAVAVPMTAADGVFDSSIESVTGAVSSVGLADGRHTIYVRGQDSAGYWGTVRAAFVWVLDPSTAAHIAGILTDSVTGLPLEGTITAGPYSTAASPATGSYDLMLPAGTYDVSALADGYGRQTVAGVVAVSGSTTTVDFAVKAYEILMEDDVESGNTGWTAEGQWAITTEASASPSHSWTDSPGADYGNDWDYSLVTPPLNLVDAAGVVLEFSHIYAFESNYDYGHVEVSTDGGAIWTTATSFNGFQTSSWDRVVIELPALDHAPNARVRFRVDTDFNTTEDGWHIDDIVIRGFDDSPPETVFRDGFESGDTTAWSVTSF